MGVTDSDNVGVAFALVIGAGAATGLGASVVFFPSLVKLASRKTLAGALGLSAGVMIYVSFVEIIAKSSYAFEDSGFSEDTSSLYMTLAFFAGVVFMVILNHVVTKLLGGHRHHGHGNHTTGQESSSPDGGDESMSDEGSVAPCPCHDDDPGHTLDKVKYMAEEMDHKEHGGGNVAAPAADAASESQAPTNFNEEESKLEELAADESEQQGKEAPEDNDKNQLMLMSLNTALAIGLHNFPEGLATFIAALDDPKVGAVLAIAIAIHNIPEGLCVAMPIYYATGNKWKAFGWAMLSGVSEPIAGFFGWVILASSFSDTLYGVLFGMVGGMMVIISVRELLPTAHRYDPEDSVVTYSFVGGMGVMALSLMLFLL